MLAGLATILINSSSVPTAWSGMRQTPCPRCVSSRKEKLKARFHVPDNAILYLFVGEFAKNPNEWLIDLDSGLVSSRPVQAVGIGERSLEILPIATLASLRRAAKKSWMRPRQRQPAIYFAPGVVTDCYIISGSRMVPFEPLDPADEVLTKTVELVIERASAQQ